MPRASLRAVLFDAVGTLIRPQPSVAAAYLAAARRHGLAVDWTEDEVSRRFRIALDRQEAIDRAAGWTTSERRERERWQAIVGEVFGTTTGESALFETLWGHFADARNWSIVGAGKERLAAARASGLLVGVASNFDARLYKLLAAMPELGVEGNLFISSEVGWRKPSAKFFRAIESQLRLAASEILLVGDDVENDLEAAKGVGWKSELIGQGSGRRFSATE